jgi:hypothetical protein
MIHIIGTAHSKTQFWSDAIKKGESLDTSAEIVERFESYLREVSVSSAATVIAEENSKYAVDQKVGGASVAKKIGEELALEHIYCDPDPEERRSLNIQRPEDRESIWMDRIQPFSPNETSIIFVCGADHCASFQSLLERSGLHARIHCQDWTQGWLATHTPEDGKA